MDWYLRFVEIEVELLWAVDILAAIYVMEFFEFYDIMEIREIFDMELWDAYNSNFEKIEGMTLVREEQDKIPAGVYHLVCEVLVRHCARKRLKKMIIESQNNNVTACRFYRKQGAVISKIDTNAYASEPGLENEVQLIWTLDLE